MRLDKCRTIKALRKFLESPKFFSVHKNEAGRIRRFMWSSGEVVLGTTEHSYLIPDKKRFVLGTADWSMLYNDEDEVNKLVLESLVDEAKKMFENDYSDVQTDKH